MLSLLGRYVVHLHINKLSPFYAMQLGGLWTFSLNECIWYVLHAAFSVFVVAVLVSLKKTLSNRSFFLLISCSCLYYLSRQRTPISNIPLSASSVVCIGSFLIIFGGFHPVTRHSNLLHFYNLREKRSYDVVYVDSDGEERRYPSVNGSEDILTTSAAPGAGLPWMQEQLPSLPHSYVSLC